MGAAQVLVAGTADECPMEVMSRTGFHRAFPEGDTAKATDDGEQTATLPAHAVSLELRRSQGSSLHVQQVLSQRYDAEFIAFIEISRCRYFANGEILHNRGLVIYEATPKVAFIDLQCPDFRLKRRTRDAESGSCPRGSEDPAATGA
jgi:hypothetical protein